VSGSDSLVSAPGGPELDLSCRQAANDVIAVAVVGEPDTGTAPQLRAYLAEKTARRPTHVVLDLSGVTFLASHGIALLTEAREGRDGIHGELHLTGVTANRSVERVLDLMGLTPRFDIHDDEDELLRRLAVVVEGAGDAAPLPPPGTPGSM
jgi:anti-sigma B factor antagonist